LIWVDQILSLSERELLEQMTFNAKRGSVSFGWGLVLILLGAIVAGMGWTIPSRFNSMPISVLREASTPKQGVLAYGFRSLVDQNLGSAKLFLEGPSRRNETEREQIVSQLGERQRSDLLLDRWGVWDPFLAAALADIPLDQYSSEPGILGVVLSNACRAALGDFFANSQNPFVGELLSTGELASYRRLFPVYSASGRPLEATLLVAALLVQGDRLRPDLRQELRMSIWEAKSSGSAASIEDFYLDLLSLARLFDFGQLKTLFSNVRDMDTVRRLRYAFHRRQDEIPTLFAACAISEAPAEVMDYLASYGDAGLDAIAFAVNFGKGSLDLLLREQLPIENVSTASLEGGASKWKGAIASFCLVHPNLSLGIKYGLFFLGAFLMSWGSSFFSAFYKERVSSALAVSQRLFISLASVVVFAVISEPNLASGRDYEGFSFRFVMPVLAQEGGETIIIETEPSTAMDPSTLLSIAFFFLLQTLVFLICVLKIREIDKKEVDNLVKLRLMENEENLFDTGLYVGIAGTCISLVLQILGMIEGNLLAAYSSNLFGILCVAIVKIRLVRPYKNKLILASEALIASLGGNKV